VCLTLWLAGCRREGASDIVAPVFQTADQLPADVAWQWSAMQLTLIRNTPGFSPPVASRAIGYGAVTLYEAVAPGLSANKSLAGQLNGLPKLPTPDPKLTYNWIASANAAEAAMMRLMHPKTTIKAKIDSLETLINTKLQTGTNADELARSQTFGRAVAAAIYDWSKTDGGDAGYDRNYPATFVPTDAPGTWRPTENGRTIPMQPYWGKNRTFIAANATLPMPTPYPVSTDVASPYFKQYNDVYQKSISLTQAEKEIAVWWADDPSETFTPPGHSYNLARIVTKATNAPLGKTAEALARTGIAVSDAFVNCWRCKFIYNNERPYTYVRRAIKSSWMPFWPAPPFPGFMSGHATQAAATASVLTAVLGDIAFTDDSHAGRARDAVRNVEFKARSYRSFWEMAEETAYSRFLGGIHTRQDNEAGTAHGKLIGNNINALAWKK
jgi:PAP2 superfamily